MHVRHLLPFCLALLLPLAAGHSLAREVPGFEEIAANRDALIEWLETEKPEVEFYTDSVESHDGAETTIALLVDGFHIEESGEALAGPDAGCEIMFLHLNVKSCVSGETGDGQWMRMYMGRKYYQRPEKAEQIELVFNSGTTEDGVSWVTLTADEGPFNTSDYFVGLYAIDAENGTYAQLHSSQKTGKAISGAMGLYFSTLGRNKIGFSVVGTDRKGNPEFSTGTQAMLERNVVRYLLALRTYIQTHTIEGIEGIHTRTAAWYEATEAYPEQLYEVDRDDYLQDKIKEYRHMVELQAEADAR